MNMLARLWNRFFGAPCWHEWELLGDKVITERGEAFIEMRWKCRKCGKTDRALYDE